MAQAQTSTSTLAYVPETVFGQTPASPAFIALPRTDFTLGLTSEQLTSSTINSNRQTTYSRRGNSSVEGDLSVELTPDNYDDFLQAALQGTWATNVLKIGKIQRSFAFEQGFDFVTESRYRVFNGVIVNTMSMEVTTDSLVTATFGLLGASETTFSTTPADASYTAALSKPIFYHEGGSFNEGGSPVGYLSAISFELTNNVAGNKALGTVGFRNITSGRVSVTGSVTGLFESTALYDKYRANTDSSLSFTLVAGAETLTFSFPKVKYTTGGITASGDAGVTVELGFEAIYDATDVSSLTITRV
jgi:hypothetical protein